MSLDSPLMLVTAVSHWPRDGAPAPLPALVVLYCRVFLPMPARRSAFAQSTLQLRHVHMRLCRAVFSSCPSTWPTSTARVAPHRAQIREPGGGQAFAR